MRLRHTAALLCPFALAIGCSHESGPAPAPTPEPPALVATPLPETVRAHLGEGPIAVYGANVYSPGQEIYKALRQEDSLMAFLACQGEPDRVEVRENESPGAPPLIFLEYSRHSLGQHGTVEIEPTRAGYYAASPIDPSGRLGPAKSPEKPRSEPKTSLQKPKERPPVTPPPAPPESQPAGEPSPAVEQKPAMPQPTPRQSDECPIEPWRADCRSLCGAGATWEWCSYRDQ
jgi:hypothetical protein